MYLKYLYKFETLVCFQVLPCTWMQWSQHCSHCWKDCLKSSVEMLSRAASHSHWASATSAKSLPFKSFFIHWYKKKVARSKVWQIRAVGHNHHFVFSQKLLDTQGFVGSGIVMVQEPIPTLPLFWMLLLQVLTQSFQHIQVKLLIYCVSWMNKLPVNYATNIKKRSQHCLDTWSNLPRFFFWSGQIWWLPLTWLLLWHWIIAIAPTLITCYSFCEKLRVIFELFLPITANIHLLKAATTWLVFDRDFTSFAMIKPLIHLYFTLGFILKIFLVHCDSYSCSFFPKRNKISHMFVIL